MERSLFELEWAPALKGCIMVRESAMLRSISKALKPVYVSPTFFVALIVYIPVTAYHEVLHYSTRTLKISLCVV